MDIFTALVLKDKYNNQHVLRDLLQKKKKKNLQTGMDLIYDTEQEKVITVVSGSIML